MIVPEISTATRESLTYSVIEQLAKEAPALLAAEAICMKYIEKSLVAYLPHHVYDRYPKVFGIHSTETYVFSLVILAMLANEGPRALFTKEVLANEDFYLKVVYLAEVILEEMKNGSLTLDTVTSTMPRVLNSIPGLACPSIEDVFSTERENWIAAISFILDRTRIACS